MQSASAQTLSDVIAEIYIGEGPTVNMSLSPKLMPLSVPGYVVEAFSGQNDSPKPIDADAIGMYYYMRQSHQSKPKQIIQVSEENLIPLAVSAVLSYNFFNESVAIHPLDTLKIASELVVKKNASGKTLTLHKISDCTNLMKYLADESSSVYSLRDLERIKPLICLK